MKISFFAAVLLLNTNLVAQEAEKVDIPKGVVYKYCDSAIFENAKAVIKKELGDAPTYNLNMGIAFIGPALWSRLSKIPALGNIKGGDMTITGYDRKKPTGKMTQNEADFKLVWDQLRAEINGQEYKMRKATYDELRYYWAVISFDIEEPLVIVETKEHRYILDLSAKELKLEWLDEAPVIK
jgi:hypothetical protein